MNSDPTNGMALFIIVIGIGAYFLPAIVACGRGALKKGVISLVSITLGWVPFVWFICIIWSMMARTEGDEERAAARLAIAVSMATTSALASAQLASAKSLVN
jgi:hypothetical protein